MRVRATFEPMPPLEGSSDRPLRRAVFLDRDGVLVEILRDAELGVLYTAFHPDQLKPTKGAADAARTFATLGYQRIVITNQPGVAKGHFTREQLERSHARLRELVDLDAIYDCPHHPTVAPCDCRKPKPGMLLRAAAERAIDLAASVFIGDSPDDVRAGQAAGCRTVLINGGRCELCPNKEPGGPRPDATVATLADAVAWVAQLD